MDREWIISPPHPRSERLAQEACVPRLVAQLLLSRGVETCTDAAKFLEPEFRLSAPDALPGCAAAAARLEAAVRERRRIVIYGDYDVDGVTATAILWRVLALAGADVHFYIPSRLEEGYGLNADALASIAADGGQVVVSVDCGITALEPARRALELGVELIITDHHAPRAELPAAAAIVHPTALGECGTPHLCGAGVALKVAWSLAQRLTGSERLPSPFREEMLEAVAFAALGAIADVAPLVGENRVIAAFGLRQLATTRNCGLRALLETAGIGDRRKVSDYDVGFLLAPRLNAIGRMGHARQAVELFTRADAAAAGEIARELESRNRERQEVERGIARQAEQMVLDRGLNREASRAIVLASADWHPGVVGIVASRIVDRYARPTILLSVDNGVAQGSGRSVPHFPLNAALEQCSAHLLSHGGHAMAAGLKLRSECIEAFTAAFQNEAARRLTSADLRPKLRLDDEVALAELDVAAQQRIEQMAPFGEGNPRPRLATQVVQVVDTPRTVGKGGAHLQFTVRQDRVYRKAIAFNRAADAEALGDARSVRVAFEPSMNEWQGRLSVDLKVLDWKPA